MIYNDLKKHCIHNCIQITDEFSGILIFTKYTNCIEGFCRWVAVPWKVFSIPLSEWNNHRGRSRHMSKVCEIIAEASTEFCRPVEPVCNRKCVSNHWNLDFSKKKKNTGVPFLMCCMWLNGYLPLVRYQRKTSTISMSSKRTTPGHVREGTRRWHPWCAWKRPSAVCLRCTNGRRGVHCVPAS